MVIALFSWTKFHAQVNETDYPLQTDRPGQSINANTVGNKLFQLQSGYSYSEEASGLYLIDAHLFDLQAKVGIVDRLEVSALFQVASFGSDFQNTQQFPFLEDDSRSTGLSRLNIAVRGTLLEGKGLKPAIGLEATYLMAGVPGENLDVPAGRFILSFQNELTDRISFTGNVIYLTTDFMQFTANLCGSITSDLGVFAEYWPIFAAAFETNQEMMRVESFLNSGAYWKMNNDLQFDLAFGFSVENQERMIEDFNPFYVQLGVTKRFNIKN